MGGRAVECTGLENRQRRKSFVGSNPTPSAFRNGPVEAAYQRSPSSPAARGRTAMPRSIHSRSVTSAWHWRSSKASAMPGRSRPPGGTTATAGGLTDLSGFRLRPGSPPRVRLPPRPRPPPQPHAGLSASVRPNPEPSFRLVQEIQAGQQHNKLPLSHMTQTHWVGSGMTGSVIEPDSNSHARMN